MSALQSQSRSQAATNIPTTIDLALIAALWCLTVVIVNPIGEFPLIDDSVYESIVKHLLETKEYRLTEVSTFPSITPTLWGLLFCLPQGVSFTALRISTLTAGLLGLMGLYTLVKEFRPHGPVGLVVTLAIGSNPVYYALSHTFMTDVPFTAMITWAAVFLTRSLKSQSGLELFVGTSLALAATLSRQIALAVPLAYAGTWVLCQRSGLSMILRAALPTLVCTGGLLAFNSWLALTGEVPAMYGFWSNMLMHGISHLKDLTTEPLSNAYIAFLYLGLFLLPVHLFVGDGLRAASVVVRMRGGRIVFVSAFIVMLLGITIRLLRGDSVLLPTDGHVLVQSGIGLLWMSGAEHVPSLPEPFWLVLTGGGVLGDVLLFAMLGTLSERLVEVLRQRATITDSEIAMVFLILCVGLYLLPFLVTGTSDRYVMPCVPFLAIVAVLSRTPSETDTTTSAKRARLVSCMLLVMAGIFSVGGTRDYLEWNRLRWQAAYDLMLHEHVRPEDIDGGAEFNSVYRVRPTNIENAFQAFVEKNNLTSVVATWNQELRRQFAILALFAWRPPATPYLISFGAVPGYSIAKEYSYHRWLPPRDQNVVVLRKD